MVSFNKNSIGSYFLTRGGKFANCIGYNENVPERFYCKVKFSILTENGVFEFYTNGFGFYDMNENSQYDILKKAEVNLFEPRGECSAISARGGDAWQKAYTTQVGKKYIIYVDGKDLPRVMHTDFETAKKEATRLAQKHTQNKVYICEIVETLKAKISVEVLNG